MFVFHGQKTLLQSFQSKDGKGNNEAANLMLMGITWAV